MPDRIDIGKYIDMAPEVPIIDVRTPAEFSSGHIPGAVNIPLFSNDERAKVGTAYKQRSPEKAYEIGYAFVEPKLDMFLSRAHAVSQAGRVAVYCWRGGMRSKAFAEHIASGGVKQVYVIEGGYKAFRTHALESFQVPEKLFILGGFTGSGKTRVLKKLSEMGEQVIDLEGIANHKGSAFGAIGQPEQPQNEHFTNLLYWKWKELDGSRPVWLEDESIHIGRVFIPEILFERMREAKVYFLRIPKEERSKLLVGEYVGIEHAPLAEAINKISKRLGGARTREALDAVEQGDFYAAAMITLDYYDKFYLKGLSRREAEKIEIIDSTTTNEGINASKLLSRIYGMSHDFS